MNGKVFGGTEKEEIVRFLHMYINFQYFIFIL